MTTAAIRSNWVGRIIDGRFVLLQWVGGSEWSGVYLTELQEPRSQKCTIKLVPADSETAETYTADRAVTTPPSYPHLIRLIQTGLCQIDSTVLFYTVAEYAEEVLSEIIPERPLTPSEAKEMLVPVLDALFYLHGKGLVHGHLKPSNIMVVDNQVKLSADSLEVAGELGKRYPTLRVYDAPEVAAGKISTASDVWSLGITLVESLTQHPPVWERSTNTEPAVPESIPQPFADIAQECLRLDPAHRCTISDIKTRLESARSLPNPAGKTRRTVPGKLRVTALIAPVVVLIGVFAALHLRSHQTRPSLLTGKLEPVPTTVALPPQSPVAGIHTSEGMAVEGAVAERILPNVPRSASRTIQGKVEVRIRVTVDPSGDVSNAAFDSPGVSKYFANLALQAARNWKFKPGQIDGQAVATVWMLRFRFRKSGTEVTPVEVSRGLGSNR